MGAEAGTGAVREVLVVLALAAAGLVLALVVAFTPWYDAVIGADRPVAVDMHAPARPGLTAAVAFGPAPPGIR